MPEEAIPAQEYQKMIGVPQRKDLWGIGALTASLLDENFTLKVANEMRRDPTIRAVWRLTTLLLKSHIGRYTHPDEELAAFVNQSLQAADGWDSCLNTLLTAPFYGFAVVECVWSVTEGKWVIAKFAPRHPTTLTRGFATDAQGTLVSVGQKRTGTTERIQIPIQKVVHWPYDADFGPGEEPEGESLLQAANRSWTTVKALIRLHNLALERGPIPLTAWPTASGTTFCPIHMEEEPRVVVYTELLSNVEAGNALVYEGGEDVGEPKVLTTENVSPEDFVAAIRYHDGKMASSMLCPKLVLEEPEHATRAMAGTQYGLFLENLAGMQAQVNRVLRDQVAWRIVLLNYANPPDDKGEWQSEELSTEDHEMWSSVVERNTRSGIRVNPGDEAKIKKMHEKVYVQPDEEGYEKPGEEEASTTAPTAAAGPLPNYEEE